MTKTVDELRKEFEKVIGLDLTEFKYSKKESKYTTRRDINGIDFIEAMYSVCTLNGAWFMFQELKK